MVPEIALEDIPKLYGLPENTKFMGFVVYRSDSKEFLAYSSEGARTDLFPWTKKAACAAVNSSPEPCRLFIREYAQDAQVALLFDTGVDLFVLS